MASPPGLSPPSPFSFLPLAGSPPHSAGITTPPLVRPAIHFSSLVKLPNFDSSAHVSFYHPAYSTHNPGMPSSSDFYASSQDIPALMFRLPAYDNGGVHHGTALAVCTVIAGNKTGYFTTNNPSGERVTDGWDHVLPENTRYYYHLHEGSECYPVCPSFRDWHFSPTAIPRAWVAAFEAHISRPNPIIGPSQMSVGVHNRDGSCRITDSRDLVENAHIVPRSEREWFVREGMDTYNSAPDLPPDHIADDIKNGFLLRRDLHSAFDSSLFCLTVKDGKVVVHFLKRTYEIGAFYHNLEFRLPAGEPALEFMWARFAWSVIPFIGKFASTRGCLVKLADGQTRRVGSKEPPRVPDRGDASTPTTTAATSRSRKRKKNHPSNDVTDINLQHATGLGTEIPRQPEAISHLSHDPNIAAASNPTGIVNLSSTWPVSPPSGEPPTPQTSHNSGARPPIAVSSQELERDCQKQQRFFPLMKEDTAWSDSYTWQTAPWYPGWDHIQRVKEWYKELHPQVGMVRQRYCAETETEEEDTELIEIVDGVYD